MITKEYLENQCELGKTQKQIAIELQCSQALISKYYLKYNIQPPKHADKNRIDLTGRIIGKLTVIKYEYTIKKTTYWSCLCECGETKVINGKHLNTQKIQSCGCIRRQAKTRKGYMEIPSNYFLDLKRKAKKRNIEFNITTEQMWDKFILQKRICALSGELIEFPKNQGRHYRSLQTASLDRINSTKGYLPDNIQWTHKHINLMKQDLADNEFITWCKKVSKFKT